LYCLDLLRFGFGVEAGMVVVYRVTAELRVKLKEPFGVLLRGSVSETMSKLRALAEKAKPPVVVSVGDTVSRNLHDVGIVPRLAITDCRSMRKSIKPSAFQGKKVVYVENPQGTITEEAAAAVRNALEGADEVHVVVDGEEDLLTLVAVLYAPVGAFVVYGQPHEGVVVVKVTSEKKAEAAAVLGAMAVRKAK
jgi:uncharacterized protein (UPF0218 family)